MIFLQQPSNWIFVIDNFQYLLKGTVTTIILAAASLLLGFFVGFPVGAIEVFTDGYLKEAIATLGVVIRGTPTVVILVALFFVLNIPDAFTAAILGLGLRSAAYQSQVFRGALQSVNQGQMEAARAIGLNRLEAIWRVIVPQALRRSIPGFQNEMTILLKDTSIAFVIGVTELLTRAHQLFVQQTSAVLEVIITIGAMYFVLTFTFNRVLDSVQNRYSTPGGRQT